MAWDGWTSTQREMNLDQTSHPSRIIPKETTDLETNCTIKDHLQDILNSGELRLDFHINTEGAIPERRTSQVAPGPKPPLSCWPPTPENHTHHSIP